MTAVPRTASTRATNARPIPTHATFTRFAAGAAAVLRGVAAAFLVRARAAR